MQNDVPRLHCTNILSRQNKVYDADLASSEYDPEDNEIFETGEDINDEFRGDLNSAINLNKDEEAKFTLVDKLGTLTLPAHTNGEAEGEVDNYGFEQNSTSGLDSGTPSVKGTYSSYNKSESNTDKLVYSVRPRRKKRKRLEINLLNCRYDSVRRVSQRFGFREVGEDEDWNLYWTDLSVSVERVVSMKKWQKINHFPGMSEICRKDALARNLNRMLKLFPKEYNIFPKTWILPADWGELQQYAREKKNRTYILKPDTGCQGRGIWITKSPREIKPTENVICQAYISRPFLIDGFKFDLRLYVLVTSIVPLRVYVYKDGLARFTTQPYREPTATNVGNVFLHLTNYAIQKHSEKFIREDEEAGTKRRVTTVNCWFIEHGYDVDKIWRDIDDVILKVLMSGLPVLRHNYRTCFPNHVETSACFEILGFDIMLDRKMRPYVIEVNHSPSFHTDSQLDKEIKEALLWDTLNLANFDFVDRKTCIEDDRRRIRERLLRGNFGKTSRDDLNAKMEQWAARALEYENEHLGSFRRIFPCAISEVYEKYINSTLTLYTETATFKARLEHSKQLREEIQERRARLESIFRPKQDKLRPESPNRNSNVNGTRRTGPKGRPGPSSVINTTQNEGVKLRPQKLRQQVTEGSKFNSLEPSPIDERAEKRRRLEMERRGALLRSLGVVDAVYRLLSGTSGVESYDKRSKDMSVGGRKMLRQLSVAKPVEIMLPEVVDTSFNNHRSNAQFAKDINKFGLHLKPRESNNSYTNPSSSQTVQNNFHEKMLPRNLPILGRSFMHDRVTPKNHRENSSESELWEIPAGRHPTPSRHEHCLVRSNAFSRINIGSWAAAASTFDNCNAFLEDFAESSQRQAKPAIMNRWSSPILDNGFSLNGGTEEVKCRSTPDTGDIPFRCINLKSNILYAQMEKINDSKPATPSTNNRFQSINGLPSTIPSKRLYLIPKEIPPSSQSAKFSRRQNLTLKNK